MRMQRKAISTGRAKGWPLEERGRNQNAVGGNGTGDAGGGWSSEPAGIRGVLTLADAPSGRAPSGARGHRVMLTAQATERALPSLLGMGVDYAPELGRHDAQRKVGIITAADLRPHGGQGAADWTSRATCSNATFPRWWTRWRGAKGGLGMSYEIADVRVVDVVAPVWVATDFKFTGAAVLLREKAAYQGTNMELAE